MEEIQAACADRFSMLPPLKSKVSELQIKIETLESKIAELEGGLKAFLNMQSMIGQENIGVLELLVAKLNAMEKGLWEKPSGDPLEKKGFTTKTSVQHRHQATTELATKYTLQSHVDRPHFFALQRYLAEAKVTGQGRVIAEYMLNITYHQGDIVLLHIPNQGLPIGEFANELELLRMQELESTETQELISKLARLIHQHSQYLAGLTQVLNKLNKKQLVDRIKLHTPPLLETKPDGYYGEVVFHFFLKNWPKDGTAYLDFQFQEESITLKKEQEVLGILSLLKRVQSVLTVQNTDQGALP